jgi:multiple sugar transport system substrate-binding protein
MSTIAPARVPRRAIAAMLTLALCFGVTGAAAVMAQDEGPGSVTMISTQLAPEAEAQRMRDVILAGFAGTTEFVPMDTTGAFINQVRVDAEVGTGEVSLLGGLHGEFAALGADGLLMDLSGLAEELGINPELAELGKLGTGEQLYIPWMQATYVMAARNEALEHLPDGADLNALTWEQLTQWGANLTEATGERLLGFPAGADGLRHRLFQGYLYPSFTGGVNTTFATAEAVAMWEWLRDTWQYVNPQSTTYGFMQEPLQSGEVWVAWDHTARLIEALRADPDGFTAFPTPAGPAGRGFMPVVAGLAVPLTAPNPDGAKELIRHLAAPETQALTLQQVSFFPVLATEIEADVDPGVAAQLAAITAQTNAPDALPSLLPVGLGEQGGPYSAVFQDALTRIIVDGAEPATVLAELAPVLQEILDTAEAACWAPDPPSEGVCQVGTMDG